MNEYKITYKSWFKWSDYIEATHYYQDDGFFSFKREGEIIVSISKETVLSVVRQKSDG